MKQLSVLNMITNVSNITCPDSHEAALFTELDNNVSKLTCTELHEAALCTELDYQSLRHNMHVVA
jgi:hypothetical protein